jgi:hypothetical protein
MKWFVGVVVVVLLAVVGVLAYLALNTNALVKTAIETVGSEQLGVAVRVARVDIQLAQGKGTIEGLSIANPAGFPAGSALTLDSLGIAFNLTASTSQVIVIDQIQVSGAQLQAVMGTDGRTNFSAILDRLESADAGGGATSDGSGSHNIKLIIERFDFTDASATAVVPLVDRPLQLSIKDVHMKDVGKREGGLPPDAVGKALLQPIVAAVVKAVKKSGAGAVQKSLEDRLSDKTKAGLDVLRQLGHPSD